MGGIAVLRRGIYGLRSVGITGTLVAMVVGVSAAMAGPAAAGPDLSESGLCGNVEWRLEKCRSGNLSAETRTFCDRIEQGFRALCGPRETIFASGSAEGAALDLLHEDYEVVPIEDANGDAFPNHLVIGPSDLDDPDIVALLREAHGVGKTVAIANATQDEARSFHRLVHAGQEVNCAPPDGQTEIGLYGLQQSVTRRPPQSSSFCLLSLDDRSAAADRRWLRDRFGAAPPQPAAGQAGLEDSRASLPGLATETSTFLSDLVERWLGGRPARAQTSSDQQLTDLATATHCSFKYTNSSVGSVEEDLYVYAMRDFDDTGCGSCTLPGADYYLVQKNVTFTPSVPEILTYILQESPPMEASSGAGLTPEFVGLEFADPQSVSTYESSYTNSSSVTTSGSVGVNASGPDVTAGGSVTAGESMTYNVPPVTILNAENLAEAYPEWLFYPENAATTGAFDVATTWTWFVPQQAYPDGGTGSGQIAFDAAASMSPYLIIPAGEVAFSASDGSTTDYAVCNVPYPFPAWTVEPPQLSSLEPTSTEIDGGQFTITGQYLYPGSVTTVLIGGQVISLNNNVDLVDDTTIDVTVGGLTIDSGAYPVQVNTQFNGETRFSNTLELKITD